MTEPAARDAPDEPDEYATDEERERARAYWATIRATVWNAKPEIEIARGFDPPPPTEPETLEQILARHAAEGPPVIRTQRMVDVLRSMGARVIVEEPEGRWTTQEA